MVGYIWAAFLLVGFVTAIINGRVDMVTNALISSAGKAVELSIALAGVMCLWTGILNIAEKSGVISFFSLIVRPLLKQLFPGIPEKHPAFGAITANMAANFFGMGNAATPLGIKAMKHLQELNFSNKSASDEMCMFLILNTCTVQLVPATIIALRTAAGSASSSAIVGTAWFAACVSCITGVTAAKAFQKCSRLRRKAWK